MTRDTTTGRANVGGDRMTHNLRSKCCDASTLIASAGTGEQTTLYYVCFQCKHPCDVIEKEDRQKAPERAERETIIILNAQDIKEEYFTVFTTSSAHFRRLKKRLGDAAVPAKLADHSWQFKIPKKYLSSNFGIRPNGRAAG